MERHLETRDLDEARSFMNVGRDWEWEAYRVATAPFSMMMDLRDLNPDSRVERSLISGGLRMLGALRPGSLYLGLYQSSDSRLVGRRIWWHGPSPKPCGRRMERMSS